jgi:hypothetical protein
VVARRAPSDPGHLRPATSQAPDTLVHHCRGSC